MKNPFKAAVLALLLWCVLVAAAPAAKAQSDCTARYDRVYDLAGKAYWHAPEVQRESLHKIQRALLVILGWLTYEHKELPPDVCGETLRTVEAQATVWHDKGWTPTEAEQEAAEHAAALKSLNDAMKVLETKE